MKTNLPQNEAQQPQTSQTPAQPQEMQQDIQQDIQPQYTTFQEHQRQHSGDLRATLTHLKAQTDPNLPGILIFDDQTGRQIDFDLRGSLEEVLERHLPTPAGQSGPGRPRLGVTAREVTLLPRHWQWLEQQRGGASATLRRLIDAERGRTAATEAVAQAQAATDRFLGSMENYLSGYEEATRALYARNLPAFMAHSQDWPADIRDHALRLAAPAFAPTAQE